MRSGNLVSRLGGTFLRAVEWGELYHKPQGLGVLFKPSELRGYFNDLTTKTTHHGPADSAGVPLVLGPKSKPFYHPMVVCQKALGHYDRWLGWGDPRDRAAFLVASRWLVATQDSRGGWRCFNQSPESQYGGISIGLPGRWTQVASPYSGMAQGQAISVLVRAYALTGTEDFRGAANKSFELMATVVSEGGVCERSQGLASIEETPMTPRNTILNGWIFGIFGLWDYWLVTRSSECRSFFQENIAGILQRIKSYDLGWWSLYDERGDVAKPFYHALHVAQMLALDLVNPDTVLKDTIREWASVAKPLNASKALAAYAIQWPTRVVLHHPLSLSRSPRGR